MKYDSLQGRLLQVGVADLLCLLNNIPLMVIAVFAIPVKQREAAAIKMFLSIQASLV